MTCYRARIRLSRGELSPGPFNCCPASSVALFMLCLCCMCCRIRPTTLSLQRRFVITEHVTQLVKRCFAPHDVSCFSLDACICDWTRRLPVRESGVRACGGEFISILAGAAAGDGGSFRLRAAKNLSARWRHRPVHLQLQQPRAVAQRPAAGYVGHDPAAVSRGRGQQPTRRLQGGKRAGHPCGGEANAPCRAILCKHPWVLTRGSAGSLPGGVGLARRRHAARRPPRPQPQPPHLPDILSRLS